MKSPSASAPQVNRGEGLKVLVIDPDPANCDVAVTMLRSRGFTVVATADHMSGVESAVSNQPAVIVTELFERTERGWLVLEMLRGMPCLVDIPVIAYSAHALPEDRDAALASGATVYLAKPLPPQAMEQAVEKVLHLGRQ